MFLDVCFQAELDVTPAICHEGGIYNPDSKKSRDAGKSLNENGTQMISSSIQLNAVQRQDIQCSN